MPVVISDTSPLRALAHLGHMEWLQELFHQIRLPPAVAVELRHPPRALAAVDVTGWQFLVIQSPSNVQRVSADGKRGQDSFFGSVPSAA